MKYVDCDPLPKAHIPTELRTFLVRLQLNQKEAHDKYFDYLLPVDERSELSQNRFKPKRTRANVQQQQPDLAIPFAENANLTLQVNTKRVGNQNLLIRFFFYLFLAGVGKYRKSTCATSSLQ